jgi:hypothetical protein
VEKPFSPLVKKLNCSEKGSALFTHWLAGEGDVVGTIHNSVQNFALERNHSQKNIYY